ncbi:MAG: TauD/TfdA dioxygenase family protein, partial [Desulfobulbia bacterium]
MSIAEAKSSGPAQIRIEQTGTHLSAELSGLKLSDELDDDEILTIENALIEHQVIVFRDQKLTSEEFLRFGRQFGNLSVHPFSPADEDAPELSVFKNDESNPPFSTDCWHSDETFRAVPPMGTMLRALDVPSFGGDTIFASMTAAYEGLSNKMQNFISGLEAYHDFKPFRKLFSQDKDSVRNLRY